MPIVPLVPHRKVGVSCIGSIIPEPEGEQIRLKCNVCGAVVGTVNAAILESWEQAIADQVVIHKFNEADEREALTGISEFCQRGECDQCPGRGQHRAR